MDFNELRDDEVAVASADHMQIICTLLQTDNLVTQFITGQTLFLTPNQQCQSTEGKHHRRQNVEIKTSVKTSV